jgi:hypothetical protein
VATRRVEIVGVAERQTPRRISVGSMTRSTRADALVDLETASHRPPMRRLVRVDGWPELRALAVPHDGTVPGAV